MRHPSTPAGNDGDTQRTRPRGAIRTHLGRKRTGPRSRALRDGVGEPTRRQQEELFDRLLGQFQEVFTRAGETTAAAFEKALDTACDALVSAGEFTADNAERMRQLLKRDLLQRDHPTMTFRTGDISTAGTFSCAGCGWTIVTNRTSVLPPCPQCTETHFRKTA
jgi:Zinc-ribbon containing domain